VKSDDNFHLFSSIPKLEQQHKEKLFNRKMDFTRLSQNVGSNIQKMSSQVSDVERMVRQIGTPADSTDLRERLHNLTHLIHNMAKETGEMLKEMNGLPPSYYQSQSQTDQRQQKLLKEKLVTQFSDCLNRFQESQRLAAKKERESFVRARAHSTTNQWNPFEDEAQKGYAGPGGARGPGQQSMPGQSQTQTALQVEEDVDLQGLREREDAIRKLEADISDVNQIFKDLAVLVHEQGEMIDSIEANVDSAQVNVQHANTQLSEARNYQSKARRKMVCIIGFLVALALILFLIIYFSVRGS
jgi:t-SNARE complex subunit (syntaxin)